MSGSASRRSSSLYAERCKFCRGIPIKQKENFVHYTESEFALAILEDSVTDQLSNVDVAVRRWRWFEAPLTWASRWIHIVPEDTNEDMGSNQ
jgi:hypothetical protein